MNTIVSYPVKLNTKAWSKISPAQYLGHLCEELPESHPLCGLSVQRLWRATRPPTLRLHKVSADNLPEAAVKRIPVVVTWDYSPSHTLPALCSWMTSHQQPVFLHWDRDRAGGSVSVRGNLWCLTFYLPLLFLYEVIFTVMTPELNQRCRFTSTAGSRLSKIQKSGIQCLPWCHQVYRAVKQGTDTDCIYQMDTAYACERVTVGVP